MVVWSRPSIASSLVGVALLLVNLQHRGGGGAGIPETRYTRAQNRLKKVERQRRRREGKLPFAAAGA
ncbi:hypothetical protein GUJ93_ZPchr0002g25578 [Zizania palustris]|uniref:Secreted protein n=1 Tax=Zizania palustris TaxID=103762 RepID=A0A8J5RTQ8_ZIZPA|nr:hypothetical protein GUJ93_ZPchr0002g25578 [Zizania palustris]